jgi:hypothetical protein
LKRLWSGPCLSGVHLPPVRVPVTAIEPAPDVKKKEDEDRSLYLAFSPFHLFLPVIQVTAEGRLHRQFGIAGIGGIGSIKSGGDLFTVWELGGQFVGYPVGHFDHGMQLGMQALYAGVSGSDPTRTVSGVGSGFDVGAFVGYKLATKIGFSFNVQGGAQYVVAHASASSGTASTSVTQSTFLPLVNLNVGWSF